MGQAAGQEEEGEERCCSESGRSLSCSTFRPRPENWTYLRDGVESREVKILSNHYENKRKYIQIHSVKVI